MKRLRQFFESIVYAGMKPGAPPAAKRAPGWPVALHGPVNRFLNGPASADPFYLTNRTTGQKLRLAILIATPLVIVAGGVFLAASGALKAQAQLPPPVKQVTNAEIAAKMLPELNAEMHLETNRELEVLDVKVRQAGGSKISGSVRNASDHAITDAEVIFDVVDSRGSRLGAVSCRFAQIQPNSTASFDNPIPQDTATYAIVREVHTH